MTNDINELAEKIYATNEANGYNDYATELKENGVRAANKHLGNKGLLVVSEVTEGQDELRKGKLPFEIYIENGKLEGWLVENIDAIIRLFGDVSEVFKAHPEELKDWTIADLINAKLEYNGRRKDTAKSGIKAF